MKPLGTHQIGGGCCQGTLGRQEGSVLTELVRQRTGRHFHRVTLVLLDGELQTHDNLDEVLQRLEGKQNY